MKLLLIEDDPFLSDLYKDQLERAGHTVVQAFEPAEGLAAMAELKPDLTILDLIMPKFSGMELLRQTKEDRNLKEAKVVVLSNIKDEKIIQEAKALGAAGYIIKTSVTPDQICEEIKKYL